MLELNKIYNLACEEGLKLLDNESIDLTVTSPPYDNLRDYKGYSFDFETIAKELFRVTKKGGVVVWIVGDATIDFCETLTSYKQVIFFVENAGFNLLDTMIYGKKSYAPAYPNMRRYAQTIEFMFVLSKGKPKTFNPIQIQKSETSILRDNTTKLVSFRQQNGDLKSKRLSNNNIEKSASNLWIYDTGFGKSSKEQIQFEHPATFPELLVNDHLQSWSNENEVILDPFMGSGTTAKVAMKLNRKFIGFEISKEYHELSEKRIKMNVDLFCGDYC